MGGYYEAAVGEFGDGWEAEEGFGGGWVEFDGHDFRLSNRILRSSGLM